MATATYTDQANLTKVGAFIDRVTMAVEYYAKYLMGQTTGDSLSLYQKKLWAKPAVTAPLGTVNQIINAVVQDAAFQNQSPIDHTLVTDAQLQAVVEAIINSTILS
jgi:hypothetical protein